MQDVQPVADEWGRLADDEVSSLVYELREVARLPRLRAVHRQLFEGLELAPGTRVLEVGSGPCVWDSALHAYTGADALIVGLDPQLGFLQAGGCTTPVASDGRTLPFASRVFDAVFCSRVLTHIGPASILINEMIRVTRHGGMVGAFEWTFSQWEIEDDNGPASDAIHNALVDHHLRPDVGVELPDLLRDAGLNGVIAVPYRERITDPFDSPVTLALIRRSVEMAMEQGAVPLQSVLEWYDHLVERTQTGRFALTRTGMAAWGRA